MHLHMWAGNLEECECGRPKLMITKAKGQIRPCLFDLHSILFERCLLYYLSLLSHIVM